MLPHALPRRVPTWLAAVLAVGAVLAAAVLSTSPARASTSVRLVTLNVNFGDSAAQIKSDINAAMGSADIITLQEVKNVNVRSLIPNEQWSVRQDTSSSDRAGSAIMVRRSIATGFGGLSLTKGVDANSCGIETRWIAKMDVTLTSGVVLTVVSLHMPPARCFGTPYDTMANNVVNFANGTPGNLILGADWNKDVLSDPNNIKGRTTLLPRAPQNSIDGFYVRQGIGGGHATNLPKGYSDHNPVQITVGVG